MLCVTWYVTKGTYGSQAICNPVAPLWVAPVCWCVDLLLLLCLQDDQAPAEVEAAGKRQRLDS
jgi:hypothetical protein